jgi:glycosyltransferase domain-containing protein
MEIMNYSKVSNQMIDELTIIIPTHNRQHVLQRAIDYFNSAGLLTIIVDSSLVPLTVNLPKKIKYFHKPNTLFAEKIYSTLQEVKTPYSCICADDDFLIKSSLFSGLEFLKKNSDYASVQGNFIQFSSKDTNSHYHPTQEKYIRHNNNSDSIESRITKGFMVPQIFALHCTSNLLKSFGIVSDLKASTIIELIVILVALCRGKHRVLPIFWMARDLERYSSYNGYRDAHKFAHKVEKTPPLDKSILVINDMPAYLNSSEGKKFKNNFIKAFKGGDYCLYERYFDLAFDDFCNRNRIILKRIEANNLGPIRKIKNVIRPVLPRALFLLYARISLYFRIRDSKIMCIKYTNEEGYPWSDNLSISEWASVKKVILKYPQLFE